MKKEQLEELFEFLESNFGLVPGMYELDESGEIAVLVVGKEEYMAELDMEIEELDEESGIVESKKRNDLH